MSLWYSKAVVLANFLGIVFIRWPHGNVSAKVKVVEDRRDRLDTALLAAAMIGGTLLPLVWLSTPLFSRFDYPLRAAAFGPGLALMLAGLWLFYRSHADLGRNWSITLQVRESHRLVTTGVYSRVRHPMYSALFLGALGQVLYLPNLVAGPGSLAGFGLLYLLRVGREERMMRERFGAEYDAYCARTGRLVP